MPEFSVVGVVGVDYCGSTALTAILDSLPGVLGAGETHWIRDRGLGCRECGAEPCPVFRADLLHRLRSSTSWWETLADGTGARVVVSSDKRPSHFVELGKPDRIIFLYKDPVAHVLSRLRRLREGGAGTVDDAIDWYVKHSINRVKWVHNAGIDSVAVSFDRLAEDLGTSVQRLSEFVGVEASPAAERFWTLPHHYVGGNFSIAAAARRGAFDGGLTASGGSVGVPDSDIDRIRTDRGVGEVVGLIEALPSL